MSRGWYVQLLWVTEVPGRISTRFRRDWGHAFPLESFCYAEVVYFFIYVVRNVWAALCREQKFEDDVTWPTWLLGCPAWASVELARLTVAGYPWAGLSVLCSLWAFLSTDLCVLYPNVILFGNIFQYDFPQRLKKSCFFFFLIKKNFNIYVRVLMELMKSFRSLRRFSYD